MRRLDWKWLVAARAYSPSVVTSPRDQELGDSRHAERPKLPPEFPKAVRAGDVRAMQRLHAPGMPLEGMLSAAAQSGQRAAVSWLLDHGVDPHEQEDSAYGPLLSADDHPDIVALLLERGAAEPSLTIAAMANAANAVNRLLADDAPVNPRGESPLAAAAGSTRGTGPSKRLLASDCMTIVSILLSHGAPVSGDALAKGVTAAALAQARSANPTETKRLVALGIDWAWHDGEDDAALPVLAAVKRGDRDSVRVLLDAGAPVDVHLGARHGDRRRGEQRRPGTHRRAPRGPRRACSTRTAAAAPSAQGSEGPAVAAANR